MKKISLAITTLLFISLVSPAIVLAETNAAISLEKFLVIRNAGISSLFLMMMAIGFAGFVGHSREYNI